MKCIYKPIIIKSICVHVSPSLIVTTNKTREMHLAHRHFGTMICRSLIKNIPKKLSLLIFLKRSSSSSLCSCFACRSFVPYLSQDCHGAALVHLQHLSILGSHQDLAVTQDNGPNGGQVCHQYAPRGLLNP